MSYIIGVDVGGTKIAAGLVLGDKVSKIVEIPTEAKLGKKRILQNITKIIHVFDNAKVSSIGIGIAGEINQKAGIVVSSPNLPKTFKNIPIKKILKKEFKKEVFVENDANCFTLAESVYGAGKKYDYVVGITLGTGVGGGIAIKNTLYRGALGYAGELGHMIVTDDGFTGGKKPGYLEVFSAGSSMSRLYKGFTGKDKEPIEVENLALKGEKNAMRVIKIMNETLSVGFANIIHVLNPDIIVVGGSLARVKMVWKPAEILAKKKLIYPELKKTKIVQSTLKNKAHVMGAALLAKK